MNDYTDMTLRIINGHPREVRFWVNGMPGCWHGNKLFFHEENEQLYATALSLCCQAA